MATSSITVVTNANLLRKAGSNLTKPVVTSPGYICPTLHGTVAQGTVVTYSNRPFLT